MAVAPTGVSRSALRTRPPFINGDYGALGKENCVLSGTSRRYFTPDFETPISIKTSLAGSIAWETPERRFEVHENTYVVLNDGQHYTMTMDSAQPSTTFCVFFERGFVEDVHRAMTKRRRALLEEPAAAMPLRLRFAEQLQPAPSHVLAATRALHAAIGGGMSSRTAAEEAFLRVAQALVLDHFEGEARRAETEISACGVATREELYRRVLRGREFLIASLAEPVSLAPAAREACLSRYHFLRTFREAFGETPHQFLTRQRLERARVLLARGDASVTEVCVASGFSSLGSFSSLFRRCYHVSPQQFQRGEKYPRSGSRAAD
jgi:AraC family transcriptional regulator